MALEMTADALERLHTELRRLETEELPAAIDEIEAATSDSINTLESSAHLTALDERQRVEAKIGRLRADIADAVVIDTPTDGRVRSGSTVTLDEDGDEMTVCIGTIHEQAGNPDTIYTSPTSPLGAALIDAEVGDTVHWNTPTGATLTATITHVA
jgi:transcription elongation factor GreA